MKDLKLKVCGMKHSENILAVAALIPDYLGFIFYEGSPRNFSGEIPEIDTAIKKTGVFVDAEIEFILDKVKKYNFNAIQLHGKESAEYCKELRSALGQNNSAEIIKVFSVKESFDFEELIPYEGVVNFFLFDTKGKNKGGNGIAFNWELLKDYPSSTPFFLSGGIGLDEVLKIEKLYAYLEKKNKSKLLFGIDVNSKFEIEAGLKDANALKNFKDNLGLDIQV
ncbi:phosphoribosylanthranilate isomerase [Gillisia mitskevichiae]|uniref:N-(5'-phosphoribosyl)anthranilate isomerase n=1 Tax=Gillisia mitskevichiae TaxID=270921 RepID=A0A495NZV6_9FLAO|nr:phosphoribosylanthranilate isomerase [Gillisia mitskevichiae]RKS43366.1 phosphoribosylanthranilate isomerase [Gillisia mitskevichiae]